MHQERATARCGLRDGDETDAHREIATSQMCTERWRRARCAQRDGDEPDVHREMSMRQTCTEPDVHGDKSALRPMCTQRWRQMRTKTDVHGDACAQRDGDRCALRRALRQVPTETECTETDVH